MNNCYWCEKEGSNSIECQDCRSDDERKEICIKSCEEDYYPEDSINLYSEINAN